MSNINDYGVYVYLMREVNKNLIKIGFSNSVYKRKENLYEEKGYTLKVISYKKFKTESIARLVESFLHKQYSQRRIEAELFALRQEEIEDIMSYFAQTEIEAPENYFNEKPKIYHNHKSKRFIIEKCNELELVKSNFNKLLANHNEVLSLSIPKAESLENELKTSKIETDILFRVFVLLPLYEKELKRFFMATLASLCFVLSFLLGFIIIACIPILDYFNIVPNNSFNTILVFIVLILFYFPLPILIINRDYINGKLLERYEFLFSFFESATNLIIENKELNMNPVIYLENFNKIVFYMKFDAKISNLLINLTSWYFEPMLIVKKNIS